MSLPTLNTAPETARSEREQTDESLRAEREKADRALEEEGVVDDTADAVINRARQRADQLVAAARARSDRRSAGTETPTVPPAILKRDRVREDQILHAERANADETLREERAEHVALLSQERATTDNDLFTERARSDEALATRDEFLGVVSHDLRDMLSSMISFARLIANGESRAGHGPDVIMYAQRIERSGARMNRLIGDLVDVAGIEAGVLAVTRELADPTSVVVEAVENFQTQASAKAILLVADIVSPLPVAALDPARILQVLTNLVGNAIKFTPPHGQVVVHVERVAEEICFSISDTGIGIPADKLEAVFGRFVQVVANDRRGVGLGLYISKSIVLGHGGRIWAEARPARGSTFCFTLPVETQG